jgi:hypothetical protein
VRYRFTANYKSHFGTYAKGDEIEIDDPELAAWLGRDSGGTIEPVTPVPEPAAPESETRAVETPPADRMVHTARKRGR